MEEARSHIIVVGWNNPVNAKAGNAANKRRYYRISYIRVCGVSNVLLVVVVVLVGWVVERGLAGGRGMN